jgi:hypothetical protein
MLRFTEETFGLDPLSLTDSRADDLRDCFTFGRAPRAFHFVRAAHDESFFLLQPPSDEPNDQA